MAVFGKIKKEIKAELKRRRDKADPYKKWEDSEDQSEVKVLWMTEAGKEPEMLGWMEVDLDIPVNLSREFIRRYCWEELNKTIFSSEVNTNQKQHHASTTRETTHPEARGLDRISG